MLRIRDRAILGTVSGLLASLPMIDAGASLSGPRVGIATTYLLSLTGTENALLKGAAVGAAASLLAPARRQRADSGIALLMEPIANMITGALYGSLCAALVMYLGDEDLFPRPDWPEVEHSSSPTFVTQNPPTYGGVPFDY